MTLFSDSKYFTDLRLETKKTDYFRALPKMSSKMDDMKRKLTFTQALFAESDRPFYRHTGSQRGLPPLCESVLWKTFECFMSAEALGHPKFCLCATLGSLWDKKKGLFDWLCPKRLGQKGLFDWLCQKDRACHTQGPIHLSHTARLDCCELSALPTSIAEYCATLFLSFH